MATMVAVDRILPNPQQPRRAFDVERLNELAESIRADKAAGGTGVIQAVTVEESPDGWFVLQDGERRLRAAKLAGLAEIPVSVAPSLNGTATKDRLIRAMVANMQREDLGPIDEARGYAELKKQGISVDEIARRTGFCRKRVDDRLKLLKLDPPIQELIALGRLPRDTRLADALLDIPNETSRVKMAKSLADKGAALLPSIAACKRAAKLLSGGVDKRGSSVMLALAARKAKLEQLPPPEWNMLFQLNRVPPWPVVSEAAMMTCDECAFRQVASEETCGQCPAVEMLARLLKGVEEKTKQWKTSTRSSKQ